MPPGLEHSLELVADVCEGIQLSPLLDGLVLLQGESMGHSRDGEGTHGQIGNVWARIEDVNRRVKTHAPARSVPDLALLFFGSSLLAAHLLGPVLPPRRSMDSAARKHEAHGVSLAELLEDCVVDAC